MANCQATKPTGKTAKPTGKKRWRLAPGDAHEWVSFKDPTGQRTWRFDVTFLLSNWRCIYGRGCQGTLTTQAPELAEGCCSYGAHFTSEADRQRVETAARALTPDQWQFATEGRRRGVARRRPGNAGMTRIVKRACIFLNRPGFPGGPGCALHRAALETGLLPMALKPDVCWQLPLRREDNTGPDGALTSTVTQWDRAHWGAGGAQFAWWCTEAPEAFGGHQPVWRSLRAELVAMTGPAAYNELRRYLEAREKAGPVLPHPAVRAKVELALHRTRS
jgi:hypothetical protein